MQRRAIFKEDDDAIYDKQTFLLQNGVARRCRPDP